MRRLFSAMSFVAFAASAAFVASHAAVSPRASVEGTVGDFDADAVTLIREDGRSAVVPRSSIPARFKVRTGERVLAHPRTGDMTKDGAGKAKAGKAKGVKD